MNYSSRKDRKDRKDRKAKKVKNNSEIGGDYKKLVLSGGGLKGLAYVGAIKALRNLELLNNIDEIIGCSIGAVFGLLIVLNYSDSELHDFLLHFHYDNVKDLDFFKIMTEWGIESGSKIETYLIGLIKDKTGLIDPTFLELYEKVDTRISLVVNAVALDDFKLYYYGVKESPDMKVVKAIRASISVPGLFTPVRYNNHILVDGGLLNNFPIDYFKNKEGVSGKSIIGLCFQQAMDPLGIKNFNGVSSYISSIIGCVLNRIERTGEMEKKLQYGLNNDPTVIIIPTNDIGAFQAVLDRTKRLHLFHNGEEAIIKAFSYTSINKTPKDTAILKDTVELTTDISKDTSKDTVELTTDISKDTSKETAATPKTTVELIPEDPAQG